MGETQALQKVQAFFQLAQGDLGENSLLNRGQIVAHVHGIKDGEEGAVVPMVVIFVGVGIQDVLRVRMHLQKFFHGGLADGVGLGLVHFHHDFKVLGFLLFQIAELDELGHHAGAHLLSAEHVGKVAAALFHAQKVANFCTGKTGLGLDAGGLVFFQVFTEVRKLVDVNVLFHVLKYN